MELKLVLCDNCHKQVLESELDAHIARHIEEQRLDALRAALDELQEDKEGVTVSGRNGVDFGLIDAGQGQGVEVVLTVNSQESKVALNTCYMSSSPRQDEDGVK